MTGTELIALPKELRIEKRVSNTVRSSAGTWLPVALLAPFAFMAEVVPAAIGILLVIGFTLREFRRSRTNVLPVLEMADRGNIEEATFQVAEMAKKERDWHRKSFLIALLSTFELRAGNRANALVLARESVRHPQDKQPVLTRSLKANLAMILMLDGKPEESLDTLPGEPTPDPVTDTNRMLIWARAGRWQEVADYKHQKLPDMQGLRHNNRIVALLKAAALYHTQGGVLKIQRFMDEARPTQAEEYDYLKADWPELNEFIEAHPELKSRRNILQRA
ncbi:MAG: hypothetical protein JKY56_26150 [Kofleriaceae bacterium]|nr:hypothetical protein [Kofleriaceae bacterium]